jgi:hypothetical protein
MNNRNLATDTEVNVDADIRPCKHMELMVNGYADGSLTGPSRWYTQLHAMHCTQCRTAIEQLRVVIDKVSDLREKSSVVREEEPEITVKLSKDRRADIERAMDDVESTLRPQKK